MDVNEEFAAKLACVRCGRALQNRAKWFRLTEQGNGLNFYYRCAKCHSVFQGVVTKQMFAQLEALAQMEASTFTGASVTATSKSARQPGIKRRRKISRPRLFRSRRTKKEMQRYASTFEKALYCEGNDFLSQQVMQEGNNWRSDSN